MTASIPSNLLGQRGGTMPGNADIDMVDMLAPMRLKLVRLDDNNTAGTTRARTATNNGMRPGFFPSAGEAGEKQEKGEVEDAAWHGTRTLYAYKAHDESYSVEAYELVQRISVENEWTLVKNRAGKLGYVPTNFLSEEADTAQIATPEIYRALYTLDESKAMGGMLAFPEGAVITKLDELVEHTEWFLGSYKGVQGIVPVNYVAPLEREGGNSEDMRPIPQIPWQSEQHPSSHPDRVQAAVTIQAIVRAYLCRKKYRPFLKRWRTKRRILKELLSTEVFYVGKLELLDETAGICRDFLAAEDVAQLFTGIDAMCNLNRTIRDSLKGIVDNYHGSCAALATLFTEMAPFFKMYSPYSDSFGDAQMLYAKLTKKKSFSKMLEKFKQDPRSDGLSLDSVLIMPIQRMPRYTLLLREILKQCVAGEDSDYAPIVEAITEVTKVSKGINDSIRTYENRNKLVQMDTLIEHHIIDSFVEPGRLFVHSGSIHMQHKKFVGAYECFLTTDCMFICKRKSKDTLKLKLNIPLLYSTVSEEVEFVQGQVEYSLTTLDGMQLPFRFSILVAPPNERETSYFFHAENETMAQSWLEMVASTQLFLMDANTQFREAIHHTKKMERSFVRTIGTNASEGYSVAPTLSLADAWTLNRQRQHQRISQHRSSVVSSTKRSYDLPWGLMRPLWTPNERAWGHAWTRIIPPGPPRWPTYPAPPEPLSQPGTLLNHSLTPAMANQPLPLLQTPTYASGSSLVTPINAPQAPFPTRSGSRSRGPQTPH